MDYREDFYTKSHSVYGFTVDLQRVLLQISSLVFLPMPFIPVFLLTLNGWDTLVSLVLLPMGGIPSHIYFFYLMHTYYHRRKELDKDSGKTWEKLEHEAMPLINSKRVLTGGRKIHSMRHCNLKDWRDFRNQLTEARHKFAQWCSKVWHMFCQWCGKICRGRPGKNDRGPDLERDATGSSSQTSSPEKLHGPVQKKYSTPENSSTPRQPRESRGPQQASSRAGSRHRELSGSTASRKNTVKPSNGGNTDYL